MRRDYFRIPPEMRKDSNMQHILVHDNLVVFWIFIQQSNYVQYRSAYLQVVNLNASAKIYRSLWFFYFCRHLRTFCECHYIHIWEICIPRSVQAKQILIGRFVECQSIKKVGGRRSVEESYQALFFVSPFPPECFTERKIEPDRRLFLGRLQGIFFPNPPTPPSKVKWFAPKPKVRTRNTKPLAALAVVGFNLLLLLLPRITHLLLNEDSRERQCRCYF